MARIEKDFLGVLHPRTWVAGLREGTGLLVEDGAIRLLGEAPCRIFRHGQPPREVVARADLGFLLDPRPVPPARRRTKSGRYAFSTCCFTKVQR